MIEKADEWFQTFPKPAEKILVVDDETNALAATNRILGRHFTVDLARSPQQALEHVNNEGPYAVVIADMLMPGMDGLQFLARLRALSPDTMQIMLTGHPDPDVIAEEADVFRFLTKPTAHEEIVATVREALVSYEAKASVSQSDNEASEDGWHALQLPARKTSRCLLLFSRAGLTFGRSGSHSNHCAA